MTSRDLPDPKTVLAKAVKKAILSEELARDHLRDIAAMESDPTVRRRILADADEEARHAIALARAADKDGLSLPSGDDDAMMDEVRAAFRTLGDDAPACSVAQDVLLEHTAIHLYESLLPAARRHAPTVAKLVEHIVAEEREHVASAVTELGALSLRQRVRALGRAFGALVPVIAKYGSVTPDTPCKKTCGTCGSRCVRVDAEAAGMPLRGGWKRLLRAIGGSVSTIGAGR